MYVIVQDVGFSFSLVASQIQADLRLHPTATAFQLDREMAFTGANMACSQLALSST